MPLPDVQQEITEHLNGLKMAIDALSRDQIERIVRTLYATYLAGGTVFIAGNGGSASTASHLACDLMQVRAGHKRIRAMALVDNAATITAVGNDLGYERIFAEQLQALGEPGDVLIVISGSGESPNILEAVRTAQLQGIQTIGLLGFRGGAVKPMLDQYVLVESTSYEHVEDIHMIVNHVVVSSLRATIRAAETQP